MEIVCQKVSKWKNVGNNCLNTLQWELQPASYPSGVSYFNYEMFKWFRRITYLDIGIIQFLSMGGLNRDNIMKRHKRVARQPKSFFL
jgi:hypothetical protein